MKAVQVGADSKLVLADVVEPQPQRAEALVRVKAISLNRGEVRRAASAAAGFRPGWDFAGGVDDLRLLFEVGRRVADGTTWPEWKPGTEFRAIREASLQRTQ